MVADLTIALDAMGGDAAPGVVIRGANIARRRFPGVRFLMYGAEAPLRQQLRRMPRLRRATSVRHTDQVISDAERPSTALRQGRESSMRRAIDAVREGEAQGVVSAGNTGALMAMAKIVLKTLPGIDRPAIASTFPTRRGQSVMLDLGANVTCDANNLVQFAVMGSVFARTVLGLARPTIGLLNVGAEDMKGNDAVRGASAALRETSLPIEFHGFIEGDEIAAGTVDVIVTDGFTGNIALKTAEGTARLYTEYLRGAFRGSLAARLGYLLARRALNKMRSRVDPRRYNGAMLLGLNGIVVKSHGATDAIGFANAIGVAIDMAAHGFNDRIISEFEQLQFAAMPNPQAAVS